MLSLKNLIHSIIIYSSLFSFIFFNLQIANLNLYVCNNYFNLDIPYNSHTGNIRYTSARYTNFFISPLPTIRYHTIIVMHKSLSLYNHNKFTVMQQICAENQCDESISVFGRKEGTN